MPYESDPVATKLNELVATSEAYFGLLWFDKLTTPEQALIAIWELVQEVYNGGLMQYFGNSSGARVPHICGILQSIGAEPVASILEQAILLAGQGIPWDDNVRRRAELGKLPAESKEQFCSLDGDLYAQMDALHFDLFHYLKEHRDEIEAPPEFWT
jgi:hypothetical protein